MPLSHMSESPQECETPSVEGGNVVVGIVTHEEWIEARKAFLVKEKEFSRLRDQLNAERRDLP
jgi:Bacterial protein of unknown function (DUF899)